MILLTIGRNAWLPNHPALRSGLAGVISFYFLVVVHRCTLSHTQSHTLSLSLSSILILARVDAPVAGGFKVFKAFLRATMLRELPHVAGPDLLFTWGRFKPNEISSPPLFWF